MIVWIVLISGFSSVLMAALAAVFAVWSVPPFTLPFNFATLVFLVAGLQLANAELGPLVNPAAAQALGDDVETALRSIQTAATAGGLEGFANAVARGLSQLFFANDVISGILIVAGIAVASRIAALFAVIGSAVGALTGLALGASGVAIYNGLWGFNSFDACPWGLPALTLPFCFGTLAFTLLKHGSTALVAVEPADITTPEGNLRAHRERSRAPAADMPAAGPQARPAT